MDRIAQTSTKERSRIFLEAGSKLNLPPYIIEKDFWVSWTLGKIFSDSGLSQELCFKGGTSLSKGFSLIDRFSEDIDLILSQHLILEPSEELLQASRTKQDKFNKMIEERAGEYISNNLKDLISSVLAPICSVNADENDKHVLWVIFPKQFAYEYIRPEIKLEIGPLALWNPNEQTQLMSFLARALPELNLKEPIVPIIKPERTFWEKITILHLEHHRPEGKNIAERHSRHYYDVYKLGNSNIKEQALNQLELLEEVVDFKNCFYPCNWANYEGAHVGTIRLLPALHSQEILAKDYKKMENMIFGEYPSWDTIIVFLEKLEKEINELLI